MTLSDRPLLKRWLIRSLIALGVVLTLLLGLIWAASGPAGRWAVMHFADERDLPRGLVLDIEGLSGNILSNPRVERISVSDTEGVFLTAETVALRWNSLALLGGQISIDRIVAAQIELNRRPVLAASSGGGGRLPSIRAGAINIQQLALGESVFGEAAVFSIEGEARLRDSGRLAVSIVRTDVEGDRVAGEITWTDDGGIEGEADAFISGNGPIAAFLNLGGRDARLAGRMSGTLNQGTGEARLTLAGEDAASAAFDWQEERWTTRIHADGSVFEAIRSLPFDPQARIRAEGTLSSFRPVLVDAEGEGWRINMTPAGPQRVSASLELSQPVWQALAGDSIAIEQAEWSGIVDYASGITADGLLRAGNIRAGGTAIEEIGGSLLFTRSEGENAIFADLTASQITLPDNPQIDSLSWVGLSAEIRQNDGLYVFEALNLTSDLLEVTGDVQLDPDGWVLAGNARLALLDIGALTDQASGTSTADLRIEHLSRNRLALGAELHGGNIQWRQETLAALLNDAEASFRITSDYTAWQIGNLGLESTEAVLRGEASGAGESWTAALDAAVNTDLALANAVIGGGAAFALEIEGEGQNATGNIVISTPRFELAGQAFAEPRLGLDFAYNPDQQTADWQLETRSGHGDLQATGTALRSSGTVVLTLDQGQLDRFGFTGGARLNEEGFTASVAGRDWRFPSGELSRVDLTASNRSGDIVITAEANGEFRDPFNLSAEARVTEGQVATRLTADWAGIAMSTSEPVIYRFSGDTPSLTGNLITGGGETHISWTAEEQLRVSIRDLPAGIVATAAALPALDGNIDLDLALGYADRRWTGTLEASATQLIVRRFAESGAVDLGLTGRLGNNLDLAITVAGVDLTGEADLVRTGAIGDLRELGSDAPLSGTMTMSGAIEPLLALVIADSRQLAGRVSADLAVSGTVFRPELRGETIISDGRYVSEELGVAIENVAAIARWDNDRFRIEQFTATGPAGGELSVSGEGGLGQNGWEASARAEFSGFNAVQRPDLSVIASGTSDVVLSRNGIDITGDVVLDRVNARPPEASAPSFSEIEVTEINRPDGSSGQPARRIPVTHDIRVRADDSIFVSGEAFSTEWRGSWHVTGSPSAPHINGDAILVNGRAFLLNRAFRFQEGRVALSGPVSSAEIDLLARHQREGLTVDARISGPVSAPQLTLSSEPSLPEDEILARLLFDRNSGQLSPLETATIAAQLSGQNLFGIVGGLRRAAGLDRLDFAAGENGEIVITGGQQLTDDVYLELESSGSALSSARLEWTLTPDFTLLSRLTGDTQASIALRWRTEYD